MSDEQYTPSMEQARDAYVLLSMSVRVSTRPSDATVRAEFDRMLAAHDADVARRAKAEELREAADWLDAMQTRDGGYPRDLPLMLHERADRIESEVTP